MATSYMPLLDEGIDVWRPIEAMALTGDTYRVEGQVPEDETWAFNPGAAVRCEWKTLSGGECLVAVGLAD